MKIRCKLCEEYKEFSTYFSLERHLKSEHNWTFKRYYVKYIFKKNKYESTNKCAGCN